MKSFKIDKNDLVLNSLLSLEMVEGEAEETQSVERVLTTGQGEWFLNIAHGLAQDELLVKNFDTERARLAIIEALYQEPRVDVVESIEFDLDREKRLLNVTLVVRMVSGVVVEEVIAFE